MFLRRTRANTGFTMIESLVAVLVLGVGVLGVSSLLANSLRFSQQSTYELVASSLVKDMAERMRANAGRVRDGGYSDIDTAVTTPRSATNPLSTPCGGAECGSRMERYDTEEWSRRVITSLPGGRGVVCHDAATYAPGTPHKWTCDRTANKALSPLVIKVGWVPRHANAAAGGGDGNASVQMVVVTSALTGK